MKKIVEGPVMRAFLANNLVVRRGESGLSSDRFSTISSSHNSVADAKSERLIKSHS